MFVIYFLIKVEITLLNNVNLTDCFTSTLKGSYDVAKKNIILCIWCNAMCLCGLRFKKTHCFPNTVHYCCSSMPRLSETDFYKAHRSEKRGVL